MSGSSEAWSGRDQKGKCARGRLSVKARELLECRRSQVFNPGHLARGIELAGPGSQEETKPGAHGSLLRKAGAEGGVFRC